MTNPIIRIHQIDINEVIDREMTAEELKAFNDENKRYAELKAQAEANRQAQAAAKAALLERLGITEEEAKLLLG